LAASLDLPKKIGIAIERHHTGQAIALERHRSVGPRHTHGMSNIIGADRADPPAFLRNNRAYPVRAVLRCEPD
jgi:hypothetical protein